jgi:hypothetical protein
VYDNSTEAAVYLVQQNITYFFDIHSDGVQAKWLRSVVPFVNDPKEEDGVDVNPWTRRGGLADSVSLLQHY